MYICLLNFKRFSRKTPAQERAVGGFAAAATPAADPRVNHLPAVSGGKWAGTFPLRPGGSPNVPAPLAIQSSLDSLKARVVPQQLESPSKQAIA